MNICHRTRYRNDNPGHFMPFKVISNVEKSPGRSLIESFTDLTIETYPGYQEHPRKNDWYPGKSVWVFVCVWRGGGGGGGWKGD